MPRSFLTPAERSMLDNARPSERVIVRDFFELLDARLVEGAALEPRRDGRLVDRGAEAGVATREPQDASPGAGPKVGAAPFDHVYAWGNNERRAELKGRRCRVLAHGAKNTVLVEFEDGQKVTTSRNAVRLVEGGADTSRKAERAQRLEAQPAGRGSSAPPSTEPLFPMHKKEAA